MDAHAARREFLSYCLSLMRAHNNEHLDSLPILDVSALKHVAYVFDALIYFMRSGSSDRSDTDLRREGFSLTLWNDQDETENEEAEEDIAVAMETESLEDQDVSNLATISSSLNASSLQNGSGKGRKHSFFQRSESTLCLGCPPPDPFETPMAEALPLADQPHLLQPNARREDLFGIPKQPITLASSGAISNNPLESLPTKLSLSTRTTDFAMSQPAKANHPISQSLNVMGPNPLVYPQNYNPDAEASAREVHVQTDTASTSANFESWLGSSSCKDTSKSKKSNSFERLLAVMKNEPEESAKDNGPQDLSRARDAEGREPKSNELFGAFAAPNLLISGDGEAQTARPQIIVSPRKTSGLEAVYQEQGDSATAMSVSNILPFGSSNEGSQDFSQSNSATTASGSSTPSTSSSRSPSKSVIVRAGSSMVN